MTRATGRSVPCGVGEERRGHGLSRWLLPPAHFDAIVEHMYRTMLSQVAPAVDAEHTATGKLHAYIRSSIAYFGTHRAALKALASLGTAHAPTDGRRFDELGPSPDVAEQLAVLDPTSILVAGQHDGEFGTSPVGSTTIASRGAVNGRGQGATRTRLRRHAVRARRDRHVRAHRGRVAARTVAIAAVGSHGDVAPCHGTPRLAFGGRLWHTNFLKTDSRQPFP